MTGGRTRRTPGARAEAVRYPPERAFVLQFSAAEESSKPTKGRVEHVLTGCSARFDSLEKLSEFVGEVLAREGGRRRGVEEE